MSEPVAPVRQLLVGAAATVADQGCIVAETLVYHAVGEFDGGVQIIRIVITVEEEFRPFLAWRKVIARESVDMRRRAQHG